MDEATIKKKVKALIAKMTVEEKVNQMILGDFSEITEGLGRGEFPELGVSAVYVQSAPIDELNAIQKANMERTRLKIPMLIAGESLHGVMCPGATMFPQGLGMGATFNRKRVAEEADTIGREASLIGIKQTYAPNLDLARDPRWGRTEETYGEDPYLTSEFAAKYVENVQRHGIACTPKHYLGYGMPEGGLNVGPVHVGERELREYMLPPFEAAVKAGAMAFMPSYSEIDGIPVHASRKWLTDVLRNELGFDGFVISDYNAIEMLLYIHRSTKTYFAAGKRALHAGVDMEAPTPMGFGNAFIKGIKRGAVPMEEVNKAVERILTVKFRLGLFENPYIKNGLKKIHNKTDVERALKAAEESIVLMKNNGILPLDKNKIRKIAVIGPNADTVQLGDYTPPYGGENAVTLRQALVKYLGEKKVAYARGCGNIKFTKKELAEAEEVARYADVAILVLGDNSNFFGGIGWGDTGVGSAVTCGEGFDVSDLRLPNSQRRLIKAVYETGTPIILVLETGRPYCIQKECDRSEAVLEAWYPGEQGGIALAKILFGEVSPSGRLPITFPYSVGHLPCFYNHKESARGIYNRPGTKTKPGRDYVNAPKTPAFPFGYGLSYTKFQYSNLRVTTDKKEYTAQVKVTVKNIGKMDGREAVLLFLRDRTAPITPVVSALRGFHKIKLKPGQSKTVTFDLNFDDFCFIDENMQKAIEPGRYIINIGGLVQEFNL